MTMSQSAHPMLGARRNQMFPTMTQADIADKTNSQFRIGGGNDCAAAASECKPKSTEKFSNCARAKVRS
jgi:hypothetical protein